MRLNAIFRRMTIALLALGILTQYVAAEDYVKVLPLLDETKTNLGQPLQYPQDDQAQITSMIVSLMPGEETGMHRHPNPTYGYVLEGEVTVTYPDEVSKTYRQGEAMLEAVNVWHNGKNTGSVPLRILAVFIGAVDSPIVIRPE